MEKLTARQFHHSTGVGDWRVADGGASAYFRTGSFEVSARFVQALAALPPVREKAPDVDLRPDGVFVRLFSEAPGPEGLSADDVTVARLISVAAAELGLTASPADVQNVVLVIDALDINRVRPFWKALLAYEERDGELSDPHRRRPVVCFQQMDAPRPQRNRIHLDVWIPHDEAEARIEAAVSAGGLIVSSDMAPSWWVLADPEGNEACTATWIGTDGLGYPTAS